MSVGKLLVVEGADGVGKTTLATQAVSQLRKSGVNIRLKSIWDSQTGQEVRQMLIGHPHDPIVQMNLVLAARRAYLLEHIIPALQRGEHILMDRWNLTTLYYQSYSPEKDGVDLTKTVFKIVKASFYDQMPYFMPPVAVITRKPIKKIDQFSTDDHFEENSALQEYVSYMFETRQGRVEDTRIDNDDSIKKSVDALTFWIQRRLEDQDGS